MSGVYFPSDPAGIFQGISFPRDFDVTWAGANPFGEGFCFGSASGQLVVTDKQGMPRSFPRVGFPRVVASQSGEAVNGVAFSEKWLAVTTRKDINFIGPFAPGAEAPEVIVMDGGAWDVTVAPKSRCFVIPLGPDGIMFVKPGTGEKEPVAISRPRGAMLNFCRALVLPGRGGNDLVVCAGRRGGLAHAEFREDMRGHSLRTMKFDDLDFVDICSPGTPDRPSAIVAAGKEGTLVCFRDIQSEETPCRVKFKGIQGTLYRVLSVAGDIYLLTSTGLYGLFGLATTLLNGVPPHVTTEILRFPIEAADANLVGDRWLLAVGADHVFRFDTEKMPKSPDEANGKAGDSKKAAMEKTNAAPSSSWEAAEQEAVSFSWEESRFEEERQMISAR